VVPGIDHLVAHPPVAPRPLVWRAIQRDLVAVELHDAIDHVERLEARVALVAEMEVIHTVDVGSRVDHAHPERIAEQHLVSVAPDQRVAKLIFQLQSLGSLVRHRRSPLFACWCSPGPSGSPDRSLNDRSFSVGCLCLLE
jgi:hypothetical protein